jgi:hypothetical protein
VETANHQDSSRAYSDCVLCHMDDRVAGRMGHELAPHAGSVLSQARPAPTFSITGCFPPSSWRCHCPPFWLRNRIFLPKCGVTVLLITCAALALCLGRELLRTSAFRRTSYLPPRKQRAVMLLNAAVEDTVTPIHSSGLYTCTDSQG